MTKFKLVLAVTLLCSSLSNAGVGSYFSELYSIANQSDDSVEQARIIRIGCYPDYKMFNYSCEIPLTWQVCAAAACKVHTDHKVPTMGEAPYVLYGVIR